MFIRQMETQISCLSMTNLAHVFRCSHLFHVSSTHMTSSLCRQPSRIDKHGKVSKMSWWWSISATENVRNHNKTFVGGYSDLKFIDRFWTRYEFRSRTLMPAQHWSCLMCGICHRCRFIHELNNMNLYRVTCSGIESNKNIHESIQQPFGPTHTETG